jgi:hypothetical protein
MSLVLRVASAGLLILAVATSGLANCLPDNMAKSGEMACCKEGQHDCGPSMQGEDCCSSSAASTEKFIAVKPAASVKPIVTLSFVPAAAPVASGARRLSSVSASVSLAVSSPPVFLLASSLRI